MTQAGAVMFSVGLMAGLLGCIWFLEVGFFLGIDDSRVDGG